MDENLMEIAEEATSRGVEQAVALARSKLPQQPPNFDGCCVECGNELPALRVRFGAVTCVPCQEIVEREGSLMKR